MTEPDLVDRVARVPSIRTPDDLDFPLLKLGSLKSPGYHMRNRPLKLHFNGQSPHHSSENTPSGTTEPSTKRGISDLDVLKDESYDMLDGEAPTFTPYIGARKPLFLVILHSFICIPCVSVRNFRWGRLI